MFNGKWWAKPLPFNLAIIYVSSGLVLVEFYFYFYTVARICAIVFFSFFVVVYFIESKKYLWNIVLTFFSGLSRINLHFDPRFIFRVSISCCPRKIYRLGTFHQNSGKCILFLYYQDILSLVLHLSSHSQMDLGY